MARHEAELRAQEIAEQLSDVIWNRLESKTNQLQFTIDGDGKLVRPPPYSHILIPQLLDVAKLPTAARMVVHGAVGQSTRQNVAIVARLGRSQRRRSGV